MTVAGSKRRVQIVCAALLHIPLVAIAAYALSEGLDRHVSLLLVGLVATIVSTLFIVSYIGRVLEPSALSAAK